LAALLSGCATSPEQDTARTWEHAWRFAPRESNPAVVIFLHGCSGFTDGNRVWGDVLRRAGFLVIMPNSYARSMRPSNCDSATYTSGWNRQVWELRRLEIEHAVQKVRALTPVPPKVFLMGQSEGGYAAQNWSEGFFDGYVIAGTTCRVINPPDGTPILFVRFETDPWDRGAQHFCQTRAQHRVKTTLHLVPGHGHDPAYDPHAQREVVNFLKQLAGR
jgi:dienelactone hydrolase